METPNQLLGAVVWRLVIEGDSLVREGTQRGAERKGESETENGPSGGPCGSSGIYFLPQP